MADADPEITEIKEEIEKPPPVEEESSDSEDENEVIESMIPKPDPDTIKRDDEEEEEEEEKTMIIGEDDNDEPKEEEKATNDKIEEEKEEEKAETETEDSKSPPASPPEDEPESAQPLPTQPEPTQPQTVGSSEVLPISTTTSPTLQSSPTSRYTINPFNPNTLASPYNAMSGSTVVPPSKTYSPTMLGSSAVSPIITSPIRQPTNRRGYYADKRIEEHKRGNKTPERKKKHRIRRSTTDKQKQRLSNLLNAILQQKFAIDRTESNYKDGFLKFYQEQEDAVRDLINRKRAVSLTFSEFQSQQEIIREKIDQINDMLRFPDSLQTTITERNLLKKTIEELANPTIRHALMAEFDAENEKWEPKIQTMALKMASKHPLIQQAIEVYDDTGNVLEATQILRTLLNDPQIDQYTRAQATKLNNEYMNIMDKNIEERKKARAANGKLDLYENEELNAKVENIYNETRAYITKKIDIIKGAIKDGDPNKKPSEILADIHNYIEKQLKKGYRILNIRHELIDGDATGKGSPESGEIKGLMNGFTIKMNGLLKYLEGMQDDLLVNDIDGKKRVLLKANIKQLDDLLNDKEYSDVINKKEFSDKYFEFTNKLRTASGTVFREIDAQIKDLQNKHDKTKDLGKQNEIQIEINKLKKLREKYVEETNVQNIKIKRGFQELVPKIINAINENSKMKTINAEIDKIFGNFKKDATVNNEPLQLKEELNESNVDKIADSLDKIIGDLESAKDIIKLYIVNNFVSDEYSTEFDSFYDQFFDSRIRAFNEIVNSLRANKYKVSKVDAVSKCEKVIADYQKIAEQLKDCKIPDIYKYYHDAYFDYFADSLGVLRKEYNGLDTDSVDYFADDSEESYINSRMAVIRKQMETIVENYNERLTRMMNEYNKIINEENDVENKQVKNLADTIKKINIKALFDDYVNMRKESFNYTAVIKKSLEMNIDLPTSSFSSSDGGPSPKKGTKKSRRKSEGDETEINSSILIDDILSPSKKSPKKAKLEVGEVGNFSRVSPKKSTKKGLAIGDLNNYSIEYKEPSLEILTKPDTGAGTRFLSYLTPKRVKQSWTTKENEDLRKENEKLRKELEDTKTKKTPEKTTETKKTPKKEEPLVINEEEIPVIAEADIPKTPPKRKDIVYDAFDEPIETTPIKDDSKFLERKVPPRNHSPFVKSSKRKSKTPIRNRKMPMEISFEDLISKENLEKQEKRVQEMRDRIIKKQVEEGDFNPLIFSEKRPLLAAAASPRNSTGRDVIKKNALGMNVVVNVPYEQTGMFETSKLNRSLAKSIHEAPLLNSSSMDDPIDSVSKVEESKEDEENEEDLL